MMRGVCRGLFGLLAVGLAGCGGDDSVHEPPPLAPVGALEVSWALVDAQGAPVECSALGADTARVAVGGEPREIACGESSALFDKLLAGRYPVVVTLHVGPVEVARQVANAEVVAGETSAVTLRFEVEPRRLDAGRITLRWRIDETAPQTRCGEIGALTMHITSEEGSIDDVDLKVSCVDAETTLLDLKPGGYTFRLRLLTPGGDQIIAQRSDSIQLEPAATARPPIVHLSTMIADTGKILGEYTVSSTAADAGCLAVDATEVRMSVWKSMVGQGSIRIESATSSCAQGRILAEGFGTEIYRVQLELLDTFGVALTSTTVDDVFVERGKTATVTVDLTP